MKPERWLITCGYVLICIIWGTTWLAIKIGLESIPPFHGIFFRFFLALIILLAILRFRKEKIPVDKNSLFLYVMLGFCSFSIPFALVYWGEQYISSGLASILFGCYPFMVAIFSQLMLKNEKLNLYKITGIILGFSGLLYIFGHDFDTVNVNFYAMVAIIVSTIIQAFSLVTIKKRGNHMSPVALNAGGMIVGVPMMMLGAMFSETANQIHFDAKGIGSILYLGTFGTVVTFLVYYWLLKHIQAVFLSLVAFITPIIAVIIGSIILNEALDPNIFVGAAIVLTGIIVTNLKDLLSLSKGVLK